MLNRRQIGLSMLAGIGTLAYTQTRSSAKPTLNTEAIMDTNIDWEHIKKSEWKDRLDDAEFYVLRKEGTERSFSSPLNAEKRAGTFVCAGCVLPLFTSETKFESGTGWPSFHTPIINNVETKRDFKLVLPRTEYHCARCGGHQGHVFKDGPKPSGLRYCNNGVALDFVPA